KNRSFSVDKRDRTPGKSPASRSEQLECWVGEDWLEKRSNWKWGKPASPARRQRKFRPISKVVAGDMHKQWISEIHCQSELICEKNKLITGKAENRRAGES
ncbi:hypothetical protein A2U01_0015898, partial [Trifolium medium]|nr:hypothetical protein [Trifolium medium]